MCTNSIDKVLRGKERGGRSTVPFFFLAFIPKPEFVHAELLSARCVRRWCAFSRRPAHRSCRPSRAVCCRRPINSPQNDAIFRRKLPHYAANRRVRSAGAESARKRTRRPARGGKPSAYPPSDSESRSDALAGVQFVAKFTWAKTPRSVWGNFVARVSPLPRFVGSSCRAPSGLLAANLPRSEWTPCRAPSGLLAAFRGDSVLHLPRRASVRFFSRLSGEYSAQARRFGWSQHLPALQQTFSRSILPPPAWVPDESPRGVRGEHI